MHMTTIHLNRFFTLQLEASAQLLVTHSVDPVHWRVSCHFVFSDKSQEQSLHQQQGLRTRQKAKFDQEPNKQKEQTGKLIHVNITYRSTHTHRVLFLRGKKRIGKTAAVRKDNEK